MQVEDKTPNVDTWADAIEAFERGDKGSKSRNSRNLNPGNLKFAGQAGVVGIDDKGFAIFDSYDSGRAALKSQLSLNLKRNPQFTLEQHMHHYLGGTGDPKATEEGDPIAYAKFIRGFKGGGFDVQPQTGGQVKPWWEVAQSFDPLMPQEQYDMAKKMYFDHFVAPKVPDGFSVSATWKAFDEQTQRDHKLDSVQRLIAPMMEPSETYIEQALAPLRATGEPGEKTLDYLHKTFEKARKLRAYEGVSHPILQSGGALTGALVSFIGVSKATGAAGLTEALPLAQDLGLEADAAALYDRVMRGSVTFSAYEASVANKEDRGVAALKGAAVGATFEGVIGIGGKLLKKGIEAKNVDKILARILTPGETGVEPELDKDLADSIVKDVEIAKQEGRSPFVVQDSSTKVPQVKVKTFKGEEISLPLEEGREQETLNKVRFHTQQGGEVVGLSYPSDQEGAVNKFLRMQEKQVEGKYNSRTVSTEPGQAEALSGHMQMEGVGAEPRGEGKIEVSTPRRVPTRDQIKEHLARQGVVEPELTNVAAQVMQLWNKDLPQKSAETMLETLKAKLKPEALNAMLPERWKLPEQSLQTVIGEKTPQVVEAVKEMGGDPEELTAEGRQGKVSRLYSLLDLPNFGDRYTTMQAEDLLVELGHDPDTLDLDLLATAKSPEALEGMLKGEEAARMLEEEVQQKARDISSPGALEEAKRKGEIVASEETMVPPSERSVVGFDPTTLRPRVISSTPSRIGIQLTPEEMQTLHPGAAALTAFPHKPLYADIFNRLGITELDPADPRPLHLYSDVQSRTNIWHENLHVGLHHASAGNKVGEDGLYNLWVTGADGGLNKHFKTANDILRRLETFPAYNGMAMGGLMEEAFVHAATAVRLGDMEKLAQLAAWDTSVRNVLNMVEDFGVKTVDLSKSQVDTYAQRVFQRAMNNVIQKSSVEQLWEMRVADGGLDTYQFFDPVKGAWHLLDASGEKITNRTFTSAAALVDHIDSTSGAAFAPSASLPLEMRGVRGPFVPRGGQPSKSLPLPEVGLPDKASWVGWKAISGAFKPMLSWTAEVDTKMNDYFSAFGKAFPIYDKVKAVDEALKTADDWIINNKEQAADFLKGNPKKLYDYMDTLTVESKYWPQMQAKLHLTDEDMINIQKAESWLKEFQSDTHIPAFNYLRDQLPRLRGSNFNTERVYGGRASEPADMSFFHRAIAEDNLNPKDAHLGRFINFLIREGAEKKFTGEAIGDLKKLVDLKGKDGSYILGSMRWPLANYVNYVRGIPDVTQQVLMRAAGDFQTGLAAQFKRLNKYLPDFAQLPEEFNYPGNFINRMMTLSYVGALGARPAIALRDMMQAFTTSLPVQGERMLMYGSRGLTSEGLELARSHGALLTKQNIGELYGDIFGEMPAGGNFMDKATKMASKLLAPSRWGHNGARSVAYNTEYYSTLDAVQKFRAGQIDAHSLLTDTSMWWYDQPAMNKLLGMAMDPSIEAEEVAKRSGLELVDTTLWPYRRGAQPAMLRTGLGRIFGQYGMWPLNYMDFLARGVKKFHQFPAQALKSSAIWTGANYAAVSAMNGAGADVGKWFFVSPAGYGGSPQLETIQALAKSFEDTDDGRASRKKVLETPLNFIPAFNEMKSVAKALEDGGDMFNPDGSPGPNLLRVLGFKPLDELHQEHLENLTPEERLQYELGEKKVR